MKLWLLRPKDGDGESGLWEPWYDKAFGFVVRAETEGQARTYAQMEGRDEVGYSNDSHPAWTDPKYSTCIELTTEGTEGVVLRDFRAA